MLPRRPAQIFRSRWSAMLWAGGVIWTAVTIAGISPSHAKHPAANADTQQSSQSDQSGQSGQMQDSNGAPVSGSEIKMLANLVG